MMAYGFHPLSMPNRWQEFVDRPVRLADGAYFEVIRPSAQRAIQLAHQLCGVLPSPFAFGVLLVYAVLWFIFEPKGLDWHAIATLATWFMTLVIQRAEHRDTQAIHAKLDEILDALGDARNEITRMDNQRR